MCASRKSSFAPAATAALMHVQRVYMPPMYVAKLRRVEIAVHRARERFSISAYAARRLLVSGRFHESMKASAMVYASVSRLLRPRVTTKKRKIERRKEKWSRRYAISYRAFPLSTKISFRSLVKRNSWNLSIIAIVLLRPCVDYNRNVTWT